MGERRPSEIIPADILDALRRLGFRIVPYQPTSRMNRAAASALSPEKRPRGWLSVNDKHAYRYQKMLDAYEEEEMPRTEIIYGVRVEIKKGDTGLFFGTSPDYRGLLVCEFSEEELIAKLPQVIRSLIEAGAQIPRCA